ncbi:hypothetical protein [Priestia endophytica]|uniref:hypothetical protein n=1 Tax=Priestia endophytica TaxID=135735 RepID=UPI002280F155|nr:hypothetical protein [Priestia endophytica]MCY8233688.1 hypothetical protein [Priestia endophytica]
MSKIEIDYEKIDKLLGINPNEPIEPTETTEEDFYSFLENFPVPPHIEILELMQEKGITEGHPMYRELMEKVESALTYKLEAKKNRGWTHLKYRVPVTREEYVVDWHMILEEWRKLIPKEYSHLKEKLKYNHL